MKNLRKYFLRGSLSHLLPLGAGFVIASSKTLEAALGMSLAVTIVTVLSAIIVSALRKVTPEKAHLPIYVLIVTCITTLVCMLMEAYWFSAYDALGVHVACLAVSAVPYRDAEELASENGEAKTILCSLVTSELFAIVMIVTAFVVEPFTYGSFFGLELGFSIGENAGLVMRYVVFAIVVAIMRAIGHKHCNDLEVEH